MRNAGESFAQKTGIDDIGCGTHIGSLWLKGWFAESACDSAKKKTNKVLDHIRASKNKHHLKKQIGLAETAKFGVPLGVESRWGTWMKSMRFMQQYKADLKALCINETLNKDLNVDVKRLLLSDDKYWSDLTWTIKTSEAIQATITKFEASNMNPAEVMWRYQRLYEKADELNRLKIINSTQKRRMTSILREKWDLCSSPAHVGIALIDLRFKGRVRLEARDVLKGEEWLEKRAGDQWERFKPLYDKMYSGEYPFDNECWKGMDVDSDAKAPFKILMKCADYADFALFVCDLLDIPGTTVSLERTFKAVRVIHNQWRRSMKEDLRTLLVKGYLNLRTIEKVRDRPFI